jgi:hypothetical protein
MTSAEDEDRCGYADHDEAERWPPAGVGDIVVAMLPEVLEPVASEAEHQQPRRSGDEPCDRRVASGDGGEQARGGCAPGHVSPDAERAVPDGDLGLRVPRAGPRWRDAGGRAVATMAVIFRDRGPDSGTGSAAGQRLANA